MLRGDMDEGHSLCKHYEMYYTTKFYLNIKELSLYPQKQAQQEGSSCIFILHVNMDELLGYACSDHGE